MIWPGPSPDIDEVSYMIDYKDIVVLLINGKDRQTLPFARAYHDLGCRVVTLNSSRLDNGFNTRYAHRKILDRKIKGDPEYLVEKTCSIVKTMKIDVVIGTSDETLELLSHHKEEIEKYSKVAVVDEGLFNLAYDKLNTLKICMDKGIPCPHTLFNITDADQINFRELTYPMVVKPRKSHGAIGFKRFDSAQALKCYLMANNENISDYVIQDYIPQTGIQYEVAMFLDNSNTVKTALCFTKNRWYPVTGGSSTLNITVEEPEIIANCSRLLREIGWRGCADIDLIYDPRDGIAKVMEINPRVSASVKILFQAGINIARQIIELAMEEEVSEYLEYDKGIRLRCIHTDLLWFIRSPDRFRSKPSWFNMKNTYDQIFAIDDPFPFLTFSIQGIMKRKQEIEKRK